MMINPQRLKELEDLPQNPTIEDIMDYFLLPHYPPYEPEPYQIKGGRPLILILKTDFTKHFDFKGRQYSKSPLADLFYKYLDNFEVVYETDPMASIEEIVEKKLGGNKPDFVLYGYTYHYGILLNPSYMKKNGISFIFTIGDIECYQRIELPKLIMSRIDCDYILSNILNVSWEIDNMRTIYDGIKNSTLIEIPWGIDESYIQNKERDIDVAFICSYDDNSGFHDKRKRIKYVIDKINGINVVTGEIFGDDYIDILNRTKIFVVEPSMRGAMVQKYLEGAVCGAMLLGEIPNHSPFVNEKNIVHISDYERLLKKKIIYYLKYDKKIRNISSNARKVVMDKYHVRDIAKWFGDFVVQKTIRVGNPKRRKNITFSTETNEMTPMTETNTEKKIGEKKIVFLCLHDWASVSTRLSEAINKYTDWEARCICKYENPFGYPNDLLERLENKAEIEKVMKEASVIVWGSSFYGYLPFNIKPRPEQYLGLWHGGSDYRKRYKMFNSEVHHLVDFVFTHRDLEKLDDHNIRLQVPFNCEDYKVPMRRWKGKIRIGHSPSSRTKKGSHHFIEAMEKLKKDYPNDVEFVLLENMSYENVIEEKRKLHIFFDQIGGYEIPREDGGNCGYGLSLVESATFGTVCMSWSDYPDTPIICVKDGQDIYIEISKLINDREMMRNISKDTRKWVVREHGYENISKYFVSIIENLTRNVDTTYRSIRSMVHGRGFINPLFGHDGICWVRDIPKVQCDGYSSTSLKCEKFFTMSDEIARLAHKHIFKRKIPYELFLNYPDYRFTPDEKRNEMVYVDNSSMNFDNYSLIIDILNDIYNSTGIDIVFISTKFHEELSRMKTHNVKVIHMFDYDYGSRYGLIVPGMSNKYYASICLPRKLLYYLSWGMVPLLHSDFKSSIEYCIDEKVNYGVYKNPSDLRGIDLYPNHNKYLYTFEYNYPTIQKMIMKKDDEEIVKNNIRMDDFWGVNQ